MSDGTAQLPSMALHFALLSLLAVGGVNSVIPEMHRQAVDMSGWMNDRQFAEMFAIAQVAPGPNVIIVALIGHHVAGVLGAGVATLAMCGPSCVLTYALTLGWQRFRQAPWRVAVQAGLVPVSVGLIAASALILALAADRNAVAAALTATTATVGTFTRFNPLWMFALAALVGYLGFV